MAQHPDQKRVQNVLVPYVMDRVLSEDPAAVLDCTVLNRALVQGPDPLFLMEVCPPEFATICEGLALSVDEGRAAIELAHTRGPGALLDGTGLPVDFDPGALGPRLDAVPLAWRREALWLILVGCSDCTEQGYSEENTLVDRLRRVSAAVCGTAFTAALLENGPRFEEALLLATARVRLFESTTVFTFDERGFPHSDADHAFYVAFRAGHRVCAVRAGGKVFWGTMPDTTLDEQGITVDVNISPSYGFVRDSATWKKET